MQWKYKQCIKQISFFDFYRNFCRLVLLLLKVGKPKIRQFFIDQWNAVKGHQRWTDCGKNGQDLLRLFANPLAHELEVIKSGNTLKWSLPLVIKVLLHLEKPLIIKKSRIKALNYLGELREEVGRNHKTVIKQPEFEKKWDDACTALTLFGATSRDFKETKKGECMVQDKKKKGKKWNNIIWKPNSLICFLFESTNVSYTGYSHLISYWHFDQ